MVRGDNNRTISSTTSTRNLSFVIFDLADKVLLYMYLQK